MAQFTAQGSIKPLFNGDGMSMVFEPRGEPCHLHHHHHYKVLGGGAAPIPLQLHKRKLRFRGSNGARLFSSSSSSVNKPNHCNADANLSVGNDYIYDVSEDTEFGSDELSCFRGLVLDISYRPVNVVCWKRAICLEFMKKADVLEYYDQTVNSPSGSFYIPAVLRVPHLLQVVKRRRIKSTLSRKNIFFRDSFTCQYCSSRENLTIDHVLPIAQGGEWTWENLIMEVADMASWNPLEKRITFDYVTACAKCNSRKGQKTLEEANMKLIKVPKAPKDYDILAIPLTSTAVKMLRMRKGTPEEWLQYLPKSSLEP